MKPNNIFTKLGDLFKWLSIRFYSLGFRNNKYWFITARGGDEPTHSDMF